MVQRVVPADVCSIRVTVVIILCLVGVLDEQGVRIAAVAFDVLIGNPLPEAQVDRFMLKAKISYPQKQEERDIMRMNLAGEGLPKVNKVTSPEDIVKARRVVEEVYMDEKIEKYIIDIIFATREPAEYNLEKLQPLIAYGGSPRASISLAKAARAYAFIRRRGYVIPEDVRAVCHDVLCHRIGLTYEAEAENITTEQIITDILNNVIVP